MQVSATFLRLFMYLLHFSTVTISQNCTIPLISFCFVLGLTSLLQNSLSSCHIFSMKFKSGDLAGVFHQLIPWLVMNSCANLEVCFGSLSCMKRCESGNFSWMNGMSVSSRISVNKNHSINPSKIQIAERPCLEIPAHTCTFTGCFALQRQKVQYHYRITIILYM